MQSPRNSGSALNLITDASTSTLAIARYGWSAEQRKSKVRISEEFPSKYLKADDLRGREVRATIARVDREKMGDDFKPVVYFNGKEKGVVLNKTNSYTIASAYGDETADWFGNDVILFSVMTEYGGKHTPAIRVRIPTARDNRQDSISTAPQRQVGGISDNMAPPAGHPINDDIPF